MKPKATVSLHRQRTSKRPARERRCIIESVDSISRDERDVPLTQYITNACIARARYTITHFKHRHRVQRLISNGMSV